MRYLIVLLLMTTPVYAQRVKLKLDDKSEVYGFLSNKTITVNTIYGDLTIPTDDIQVIIFSLHNTSDEDTNIKNTLRRLGSDVFKERKQAYNDMINFGRKALPILTTHNDPEINKAIKIIKESISNKNLRIVNKNDIIKTKHFDITGVIKEKDFNIVSPILGDIKLKLSDIDTLYLLNNNTYKYVILPDSEWFATGIRLDSSMTITAIGSVDLWSQAPGQYLTTPKGFNTNGKNSAHKAGALIGKIDDGPQFLIGEQLKISVKGELYLQIVPSPWDNKSDGKYDVEIKVGEQ